MKNYANYVAHALSIPCFLLNLESVVVRIACFFTFRFEAMTICARSKQKRGRMFGSGAFFFVLLLRKSEELDH